MRVIFLEDVPGTADAGEIREVKNGFARNYLLPRNLAAPATPGQLQRVAMILKEADKKRLHLADAAKDVALAMEGQRLTVEARVGPSGRLFGAVTGRHIADELNKLTTAGLDHRNILLGAAIHAPGEYTVPVRLYRDVTAQITVSVVPEGYAGQEVPAIDSEEEASSPPTAGSAAPSTEESTTQSGGQGSAPSDTTASNQYQGIVPSEGDTEKEQN